MANRDIIMSSATPQDITRFWGKVKKGPIEKCWEWQASVNGKGYGQLSMQGATIKAHRLAYTLARGPIPSNMCVCHHCDNPPCCNPSHLFIGTHADNKLDAILKGRAKRAQPGEPSRHVLKARRRADMAREVEGGANPAAVAVKHGVCLVTARNACREHSVDYTQEMPRSRPRGKPRGRPRGSMNKKFLAVLASLLETPRQTMAKIGQIHGISRQRVHQVAKQAGEAGIKI